MRIRSPSLPELHAFVAVVETGSFSRAALRLSVTQGAVSRSVLRLEERLSITLLDRSSAGVKPTSAGQTYYSRIQSALTTLEDAVPNEQPSGPQQMLRVSAISSLNMRWLVPRLPLLNAQHPWLQLAFKPYWSGDTMQRDDVDCYIEARPTSKSRWPSHIEATYVTGKEIVPICHPSVAQRIRSAVDLTRLPMLHHANYPGNWAWWLQHQGVDAGHLKLGPGFDLGAGLIEAVAANMGVAVIQCCLIEREVSQGRVVVPLDKPVSTGRGYYLCVPKARADSPAVVAFKTWLLESAAMS